MALVLLALLAFSMVLPSSVVSSRMVAGPGDLLPGFGANGVVMTDFAGGNDAAQAVTASRLGNIVVAGSATVAGNGTDFALALYDKNGSLVPSFGQGGKVTTDFFAGNDGARGVVVQDDGKLVVSGFATNGATRVFALARYLENGGLDPTFGREGRLALDLGSTSEAFKLALQPDGKIVVVGDSRPQNSLDFTVVRLNPVNGSLDSSFGTDGVVRVDFGFTDRAVDVVIDDANIFVCGFVVKSQTDSDFGIARLNLSNGSLNNAFDGDGTITIDFFGKRDGAQSLVLRRPLPGVNAATDVHVIVGGFATPQASDATDFAVAALDAQGRSINTLFNQGKEAVDFNGSTDQIFRLVGQPNGAIVGIGWAGVGANFDLGMAKWDPTGKLESNWAPQRKTTLDTAAGGNNVAFDGMIYLNNLVAAGTGINPASGNDDLVITFHENALRGGEALHPISISGPVTSFIRPDCGRFGSLTIAGVTVQFDGIDPRFEVTQGIVLNTGLSGHATVPAQPFDVIGTGWRINGYSTEDGRLQQWVSTARTTARIFDITGRVQAVSPTSVTIKGLTFQVAPGTTIPPDLVVGAAVRASGELDTNNRIAAIQVDPNPYRTTTVCANVQNLFSAEAITFSQNANVRCDSTVGRLNFDGGQTISLAPGLNIPGVASSGNQCFSVVSDQFGYATTGTVVIPR